MPAPPGLGCPIPGAQGCVAPIGPVDAPLLLVGEAAGFQEAIHGEPFWPDAPAGGLLGRLLRAIGVERSAVRIANVIQCHPPGDYLVGAPWEGQALTHCRPALDAVLAEPHKVVVPLGGTALRAVLSLPRKRGKEAARVADFHGTVNPLGDKWVVPTFHPAFLSRGQQKLQRTVIFDLTVARDLAYGKLTPDFPELIVDPDLTWFQRWIEAYLRNCDDCWLSVDIETPEKGDDESELIAGVGSAKILRINLSWHPGEGVTVPADPRYMEILKPALASPGIKIFWNGTVFDIPRLELNNAPVNGPIFDGMDGWHVLHSDLPRGLGFVAPHYSHAPAHKHLGTDSVIYCAMDGVQPVRAAYGIAKDLEAEGLWHVYERYCQEFDRVVLRPAERVGLRFSKPQLRLFRARLSRTTRSIESEVQSLVPEELKPLEGPLKRRPDGDNVVEVREVLATLVCDTCRAVDIQRRHRCEDRSLAPAPTVRDAEVVRFYRRLAFNPASWQQMLGYIHHKRHRPGKAKKTRKDTTDKKTLLRLVKTGDPLYSLVLQHRALSKLKGTYADGVLERIDKEGRVHPTFGHKPSTGRLSCKNPNFQNFASHVEGYNHLTKEFRDCVVASPGCVLIAADYSGIEAVQVGWFARDPQYIRLARLGVHAYVASHVLGRPADLKWSDADLKAYFAEIKTGEPKIYERAKRCVHGRNYGLTEFGMSDYYPDIFPKRTDAAKLIAIYEGVCPSLPKWQAEVRATADRQKYLETPYGWRHWFFDVTTWTKGKGGWEEGPGEDWKRAVAFLPQGQSGQVLCEASLRLLTTGAPHYIGDMYHGLTPLRALIHDEIFIEVEERHEAKAIEALQIEMMRPIPVQPCPEAWGIGPLLSIGVSIKRGTAWGSMTQVGLPDLAADVWREPEEDEEVVA